MRWPRSQSGPTDGRSVARTLAVLVALGAVGGAALVGFGLYDVSAKSGHLPGVSWVLHTTFRNAVARRADADVPDDLHAPDMVALGAGHFDSACKPCHAGPGSTRSATIRAMVPQPPHIAEAVLGWQPEELHWVVHEGVKMSGMPGWPAARDDDVWPVVAFLMAVPGMDGADYARLIEKPDGEYCAMCHGTTGVPENRQIPRLDILSETYIAASLAAYRDGRRDSGIMAQAMSQVPRQAIADLAAAFATTAPAGGAQPLDERARAGRALAARGGTTELPACRACHGPWPEPLNPAFPALAGQHAPYLEAQLRLWRDGNRGGGAAAALMHHASRDLTDDDIAALAAYYAALAPAKLDDTRE